MRWVIVTILLLWVPPVFANTAGNIGKMTGSGAIERGQETITGGDGVSIEMQDTAVTARGTMRLDFMDDTRVDLTEHARLTIDEFVYDPNTSTGKLSLKASFGTIRYASGQIAKNSRQDVKISTPTAVIGVRGTDF